MTTADEQALSEYRHSLNNAYFQSDLQLNKNRYRVARLFSVAGR